MDRPKSRAGVVAVAVCLTGFLTSCTNPTAHGGISPGPSAVSASSPTSPPSPFTMPNLVGLPLQSAQADVASAIGRCGACDVSVETGSSYSFKPAGIVVATNPPAGTKVYPGGAILLTVSRRIATEVATEVAAALSTSVTYVVATSRAGYVLECNQSPCQGDAYKVPFGRALILGGGVISAQGRSGFYAIKSAVEGSLGVLKGEGFRFVLLAASKTIVMGYTLTDWLNFGTWKQPSSPLLGLITAPSLLKYATAAAPVP